LPRTARAPGLLREIRLDGDNRADRSLMWTWGRAIADSRVLEGKMNVKKTDSRAGATYLCRGPELGSGTTNIITG